MVYKMKHSLRVLDLALLVFRNVLVKSDWDFVLTKNIIINFRNIKIFAEIIS